MKLDTKMHSELGGELEFTGRHANIVSVDTFACNDENLKFFGL